MEVRAEEDVYRLLDQRLIKQGYHLVGRHSSVKKCYWNHAALVEGRFCYKGKFYGIESHRCIQLSVTNHWCWNACLHCWRLRPQDVGIQWNETRMPFADDPRSIVEGAIREYRRIISGYKGRPGVDPKMYQEATNPKHVAISLTGEATLYRDPREFDYLTTKGISRFKENEMTGPQAFLNDRGGFIDDFMGYRVSEREFLIVTNAINREKIISWIRRNSSLSVEDLTFKYVMLAIQGREVWKFVPKPELDPLRFVMNVNFLGVNVFLLSRSGWTGEDGVEIWADPSSAEALVKKLIELGVKPAGLITRDSIRQEMGFVLYGEDIDENVTPIEARYWIFDSDRDYIGSGALKEQLRAGVKRLRVGLKAKKGETKLPRHGQGLYVGDTKIGEVTSSTHSPYLNRVIGMGYVTSHSFTNI